MAAGTEDASGGAPPGLAPSLPASWYCDPAVFARERERIFARHWILVAREEQLAAPGDFVTDTIAGFPVFVARQAGGALGAYHNLCRHRASPLLTEETGRRQVLRCPYHGWTYGLDGQLRKAPGFPGREALGPSNCDLLPVRAAAWNGLVFACLDPAAPDLEAWLGEILEIAAGYPPLETLAFLGEQRFEGAADWKAYSDNSAEGYHLPHVHKDLTAALVREATEIRNYERGQFVGFSVRYKASPGWPESRGFWIYKFPGLLLHFSENEFNLERVIPLAPGRVALRRWFWCPPGEQEKFQVVMEESTAVMREDLAICEAVQRNLEAGVYRSGLVSEEQEPGTAYFQRLVREALEGPA